MNESPKFTRVYIEIAYLSPSFINILQQWKWEFGANSPTDDGVLDGEYWKVYVWFVFLYLLPPLVTYTNGRGARNVMVIVV